MFRHHKGKELITQPSMKAFPKSDSPEIRASGHKMFWHHKGKDLITQPSMKAFPKCIVNVGLDRPEVYLSTCTPLNTLHLHPK